MHIQGSNFHLKYFKSNGIFTPIRHVIITEMRGTPADITHTQYAGGVGSYNNRLHFLSPISTLFAQEIPLTFGMEVKQIWEFTRPGYIIVNGGHNVLDFPDKLTCLPS